MSWSNSCYYELLLLFTRHEITVSYESFLISDTSRKYQQSCWKCCNTFQLVSSIYYYNDSTTTFGLEQWRYPLRACVFLNQMVTRNLDMVSRQRSILLWFLGDQLLPVADVDDVAKNEVVLVPRWSTRLCHISHIRT